MEHPCILHPGATVISIIPHLSVCVCVCVCNLLDGKLHTLLPFSPKSCCVHILRIEIMYCP